LRYIGQPCLKNKPHIDVSEVLEEKEIHVKQWVWLTSHYRAHAARPACSEVSIACFWVIERVRREKFMTLTLPIIH
jgi:hypothetical protein